MRHFLEQVHEFKDGKVQTPDWEASLSLTSTLTLPERSAFAEIKKAIQTRDALVRKRRSLQSTCAKVEREKLNGHLADLLARWTNLGSNVER